MKPVDVVDRLCSRAKPAYREAIDQGSAQFKKYGLTTPKRMSQFLAQIFHESGGLTIDWESGNYSAERLMEIFGVGHHSAAITWPEATKLAHNGPAIFERVYGLGNPSKAKELGNVHPGDGWKFRGGGLMQTTGGDNYRRIGQKIGVDLYSHPELVLDPRYALLPALVEWDEEKLNSYADKGDVLSISKAINLGNAKSSKTPNGLADRKDWLRKINSILTTLELDATPPEPLVLPVLALGSRGTDVVRLQKLLVESGITVDVDGDFGEVTKTAVTKFQEKNHLVVDGVVGKMTWQVLIKGLMA